MTIRENAISFTVRLTRVALSSDGGVTFGFASHPHEDVSADQFKSYLKTSFLMALVPLDENEQPIEAGQDNPNKGGASSEPSQYASATAQDPAPARSLSAEAGALCADPVFWKYLETQYCVTIPSKKEAAEILKASLGITSRKEILPGTSAAKNFLTIQTDFQKWKLFGKSTMEPVF